MPDDRPPAEADLLNLLKPFATTPDSTYRALTWYLAAAHAVVTYDGAVAAFEALSASEDAVIPPGLELDLREELARWSDAWSALWGAERVDPDVVADARAFITEHLDDYERWLASTSEPRRRGTGARNGRA